MSFNHGRGYGGGAGHGGSDAVEVVVGEDEFGRGGGNGHVALNSNEAADGAIESFNLIRATVSSQFQSKDAIYAKICAFLDSRASAQATFARGGDAGRFGERANAAGGEPGRRVILRLEDLNEIAEGFPERVLKEPLLTFAASEAGLADCTRSIASGRAEGGGGGGGLGTYDGGTGAGALVKSVHVCGRQTEAPVRLGLSGWLGRHAVTPRGLSALLANRMVCVEGIVTRRADNMPILEQATYFVPEADRLITRSAGDGYAVLPNSMVSRMLTGRLTRDAEGRETVLEPGLSQYRDRQRLTLQEMPENLPAGQLPLFCQVILNDDLVDAAKPGDRIRVYGVAKAMITKLGATAACNGEGRMVVIANNIEPAGGAGSNECVGSDNREGSLWRTLQPHLSIAEMVLTDRVLKREVEKQLKLVSKYEFTLDLLARSLASGICGKENVKKGLVLQLVGGERKVVEGDGTRLRGDIHVLLLGDPSCGKSQLLRSMLALSPVAISTTGRGSSAVGLTGAITVDPDVNERRIEAGAMVLADQGIVCVDEFDKMAQTDRVAVHEIMEQQQVTINKAGLSATLIARCSVLAAANPRYGLFDDKRPYHDQIDFPDSLLSRFDLIYIIRESSSQAEDKKISNQLLASARAANAASVSVGGSGADGGLGAGADGTRLVQPHALARIGASVEGGTGGAGMAGTGSSKSKFRSIWRSLPTPTDAFGEAGPARHPPLPRSRSSHRGIGLGISSSGSSDPCNDHTRILSHDFLRFYIQYCRHNAHPQLTDDATERMAEFYAEIRRKIRNSQASKKQNNPSIPTPRLLEACIRLATAHAKLKLKQFVEESDVAEAEQLLRITYLAEDDRQPDGTEGNSDGERDGGVGVRRGRGRGGEGDEGGDATPTGGVRGGMRLRSRGGVTPGEADADEDTGSAPTSASKRKRMDMGLTPSAVRGDRSRAAAKGGTVRMNGGSIFKKNGDLNGDLNEYGLALADRVLKIVDNLCGLHGEEWVETYKLYTIVSIHLTRRMLSVETCIGNHHRNSQRKDSAAYLTPLTPCR